MSVPIMSPLFKCVGDRVVIKKLTSLMKWQALESPPPSVAKIRMQNDLNISLNMRPYHSHFAFHITQMLLLVFSLPGCDTSSHIYSGHI